MSVSKELSFDYVFESVQNFDVIVQPCLRTLKVIRAYVPNDMCILILIFSLEQFFD